MDCSLSFLVDQGATQVRERVALKIVVFLIWSVDKILLKLGQKPLEPYFDGRA
jgi:hypothetical protein